MKKSAFFIKMIISFGFLSLLLSDVLASGTSSNHITLYTHALELKPIPSSFQLAKSTFLPDRFDDLGLSNYNTLESNYNSVNCDTYPLSSCPAGSQCETCPFDAKKFRVLSCQDPYIFSSGTCVCPTKVSLIYANDRCTKYCGSTCIAKTCSPSTNQSGCSNGTQSCDNGCGANTRQCCVACAHKVTSKPSYASYTYSSCYDGSTKQIQTGWKCNSGYHQKDSTCEKDCITNNCSGYSLSSCPANANCTPCTITATNCTTSGTKYKVDSCQNGYYQSGNSCIKNCEVNSCSGYTLTSCPANANCSSCTITASNCTTSGTKYKISSCYSGYKLSSNSCIKDNGLLGYILYSDLTVSAPDTIISGKTPIGVVFDSDNKKAINLTYVKDYWSHEQYDIPNLANTTTESLAFSDVNGRSNTLVIKNFYEANNKASTYPVPYYTDQYSTLGTKPGDWYLPSVGELMLIYNNKSILNSTLLKLTGSYLPTPWIWTSSEQSKLNTWSFNMNSGDIYAGSKLGNGSYIILAIEYENL